MGIDAVRGAPQVYDNTYGAVPKSPTEGKPEERSPEEQTTVTTHCSKKHWHDQSCPHTATTQPAPKPGASGSRLNVLV